MPTIVRKLCVRARQVWLAPVASLGTQDPPRPKGCKTFALLEMSALVAPRASLSFTVVSSVYSQEAQNDSDRRFQHVVLQWYFSGEVEKEANNSTDPTLYSRVPVFEDENAKWGQKMIAQKLLTVLETAEGLGEAGLCK